MLSSVELSNQYLFYNKKFFGNKLPRISVLWKKPYISDHAAEFVTFKDGTSLILINPLLKKFENYTLENLLHEMCHIKLKDHANPKVRTSHGPLFQREMKRLAKLDAFRYLW